MNKYLLLDYFLIFLFLIVIFLLFYDLRKHTDEKSICVKNPLIYGASQLKEKNNAEFSCTCFLDKPNSPIIYFNSKRMNVEFPKTEKAELDINVSEWEKLIPAS